MTKNNEDRERLLSLYKFKVITVFVECLDNV